MLAECKCYARLCKHYLGIQQPDGTEMTEANYCETFADYILDEIAYGDNKYLTVEKGQENNIVYQKGDFRWERGEGEGTTSQYMLRF